MRKGFTLVELLAVIAIVAVLGIITVPMIMTTVEDSKKAAFTTGAQSVLEVAKTYVTRIEENGNYIYICKSYQNDLQSKTIAIYKLKINNENNIVHLYKGKQYIFSDKIDYFTMVHDVSSKNVDYEVNFETLTITINGYDEPLVDENGNVINPNYKEYRKQYIDENYQCYFEKKSF